MNSSSSTLLAFDLRKLFDCLATVEGQRIDFTGYIDWREKRPKLSFEIEILYLPEEKKK